MGSSSETVDQTTRKTETKITDRRAIQQQGMQILDSVIVDNDDKVMMAAMDNIRVAFLEASDRNTTGIRIFQDLAGKVLTMADKGQVAISDMAYKMLQSSQRQLDAMEAQGELVMKLADNATEGAMSLADKVSTYQMEAQRDALQILAETKTGDYSDNLKTLAGMIMLFALGAILIVKGK